MKMKKFEEVVVELNETVEDDVMVDYCGNNDGFENWLRSSTSHFKNADDLFKTHIDTINKLIKERNEEYEKYINEAMFKLSSLETAFVEFFNKNKQRLSNNGSKIQLVIKRELLDNDSTKAIIDILNIIKAKHNLDADFEICATNCIEDGKMYLTVKDYISINELNKTTTFESKPFDEVDKFIFEPNINKRYGVINLNDGDVVEDGEFAGAIIANPNYIK